MPAADALPSRPSRRSSEPCSVTWKHLGLVALVSYALGICAFLLWSALTRPIPRGPNGPTVRKNSGYPPKYGKIPEKTIWFYYNKGWDPMPNRLVDLCVQTFCVNNPDWNFEFVSDSNVHEYVTPEMLPAAWSWHKPANKKDMVMANVLALYGGVAVDSTILNFKSLNVLWNRMLTEGADAVIYWYRFTEPWSEHDSSAAWFFMARRDTGIFRRYAQDIKTHFGQVHLDLSRVGGKPYLAFATGTVEPIMIEINSSLPLCSTDPNTAGHKTCATAMTHHVAANKDLNNTKVVFLDPNDQNHGPQLSTWEALCINWGFLNCPTPTLARASAKDLWEQYQGRKDNPYFTMIKLFGGGGRFAKQHPQLLLLNKDDERENVMSMWFKDAGIELDKPNYCGSRQLVKNERLRSGTTDQSASTFRFATEYV